MGGSPDDVIDAIAQLNGLGDFLTNDEAEAQAVEILLRFLEEQGYGKVVKAYEVAIARLSEQP